MGALLIVTRSRMGNCLGISSERKQPLSNSKETMQRMLDLISGERPRWPSLLPVTDIENTPTRTDLDVQLRTVERKRTVKCRNSSAPFVTISQEWLSQSRAAAEAQKQAIQAKLSKCRCGVSSSFEHQERESGCSEPNSPVFFAEMVKDRSLQQQYNALSTPANHHKRRHSNLGAPTSNPEHDSSAESANASALDHAAPDEAELSHDETHDLNGSTADIRDRSPPDKPPFLERAHCALRTLLSGAMNPGDRSPGRRPATQGAPPRRRPAPPPRARDGVAAR